HTRGSTGVEDDFTGIGEVSPAYAGIDPKISAPIGRTGRFPRIRGDRPASRAYHWALRLFPPHTRGSTPRAICDECQGRVSPAYAGIDRQWSAAAAWIACFPRIRGDRPPGDRLERYWWLF